MRLTSSIGPSMHLKMKRNSDSSLTLSEIYKFCIRLQLICNLEGKTQGQPKLSLLSWMMILMLFTLNVGLINRVEDPVIFGTKSLNTSSKLYVYPEN